MTRLKLDPAYKSKKGIKDDEKFLEDQMFNGIFPILDKYLVRKKCIASDNMTLADILIYGDIS